jgi:hypothetical protein
MQAFTMIRMPLEPVPAAFERNTIKKGAFAIVDMLQACAVQNPMGRGACAAT